jgi:hypothetical protein
VIISFLLTSVFLPRVNLFGLPRPSLLSSRLLWLFHCKAPVSRRGPGHDGVAASLLPFGQAISLRSILLGGVTGAGITQHRHRLLQPVVIGLPAHHPPDDLREHDSDTRITLLAHAASSSLAGDMDPCKASRLRPIDWRRWRSRTICWRCLSSSLSCSARFVTNEGLKGKALLFGHKTQQSVNLSGEVKPLGMGVASELDRDVDFSRIGFGACLHRLSGWGFTPA